MAGVNFYLKKAEESTGLSLIYLQYKYSGHRLVFTFNERIDPKSWNAKKQRVKSNAQTSESGQYLLNELLDKLENIVETTHNAEKRNGVPPPSVLKMKLIAFIENKDEDDKAATLYKLAERFVKGEIKHKGKMKARDTMKTYKTVLNHLKDFELKYRYPVDFATITLDFYYKYLTYLKTVPQKTKTGKVIKNGLSQNTIAKHVQVIKTFMNEAVDLGYTTNMQFKHRKFSATWEDTDAVYLNEKEIQEIAKVDLSKNSRLDQVRDLFLFGCAVGLRFSDFSSVRPNNIVEIEGEQFIKVKTKKTGDVVIIPCDRIVLQIFEKYAESPNKLPKSISNQKFNQYVKEVCKAAGLTEKGRLLNEPDMELWECVSSHTCRRSFATNLYLQNFPPIEIRKITGHKTESSFLKYIKVSKLDAAKRLSKHMQMRWNEKIMKVVA